MLIIVHRSARQVLPRHPLGVKEHVKSSKDAALITVTLLGQPNSRSCALRSAAEQERVQRVV